MRVQSSNGPLLHEEVRPISVYKNRCGRIYKVKINEIKFKEMRLNLRKLYRTKINVVIMHMFTIKF